MDYDLVAKTHINELKNYLKVRELEISGSKNELVARVFSVMENNVMPVKTAVEVKEDLNKEYEKKLRVDDRLIPHLISIILKNFIVLLKMDVLFSAVPKPDVDFITDLVKQ